MKQSLLGAFALLGICSLHEGLHAQTMEVSWASYSPAIRSLASAETRSAITSVTANFTGNRVNFNWQGEGNGGGFVMERSTDGIRFEPVGKTKAASEGLTAVQYSYSDKLHRQLVAKTDLYYRIGYPSSQGLVYTKPMLVSTQRKGVVDYAVVFPRPEDNDIQVALGLRENSFLSVRITDNQGNLVLDRKMKLMQGDQQLTLTGTHMMAPGAYWLEVIGNGQPALQMQLVKE